MVVSLGRPIRPEQAKPEKVAVYYVMCYSKFGRSLMLPSFSFCSHWLLFPPFSACVIAIVSMAKVGIVGQREEPKPEEVVVELGERQG